MKMSMYHAIDSDLGYRMDAVVPFIESHSLRTPGSFARTFANSSDSSIVGVFVQISDAHSGLLYQSDVLSLHHVPVLQQGFPNSSIARSTEQHEGWTIRIATERVFVNGVPLTVHVVEPLSDLRDPEVLVAVPPAWALRVASYVVRRYLKEATARQGTEPTPVACPIFVPLEELV